MNQQMQSWQTASNIVQLSELSNQAAAALQHLQRERGRSASFLGSAGNSFSQELQEQQAQTDQQINKLEQYL
ncbi:MAG: nitrate- and nitrite sensing domain-containing protein, partial [Thiopseudomonas sp.]|nr:nitrate- and nitrite sensing domain-containing protein [Thiopseudomonas sp.]